MTLGENKVQELLDSRHLVSQEKKDEFSGLFKEFLASYPTTPAGQTHIAAYSISRKAGQANLEGIVVAASRGQDVTDDVLLKLLPYVNTPANRSKGGWIHWAPTINGDIRLWFERAGRTKPEDWPQIADAILRFVQRCVEDPEQLSQAVAEFSALPYSKGLQTGMLTPILNAVRPDDFTLINNKSRALVNYFTGQAFTQPLTDYPSTNLAAQALVRELGTLMHEQEAPALSDSDLFDMFGHWLVAVKHYGFRDTRYWKIAPGESAWQWDDCRQDGFIAIGWDELGDLSGISRSEYLERRDPLCAEHGWAKTSVDQVWAFTSRIREGDRIVANRGKKEVVGIGTVVGPYFFVPGQRNGHRLSVEWDDTTVRPIKELGWQRTLIELDRAKFDSISRLSGAAPGNTASAANDAGLTGTQPAGRLVSPFSVIFDSLEEADWAFDFLADVVRRLGGSGFNDQRFSFTLPVAHKQRLMRLNFCAWMVVDFVRPESGQELQVHITLLSAGMTPLGLHVSMEGPFSQEEGAPEVRIYLLPSSTLKSMSEELRVVYEDSLDYIARKFFSWQTSQYPFAHRQELFEAIFDKELRHRLFAKGMSDRVSASVSIAEDRGEYIEGHETSDGEEPVELAPLFPLAQFAEQTGFDQDTLERWVRAINRKGQAILYGPPGTGKTFVAEQLARHLIGGGDGFCDLVQFHPAYAYEDFIQGIRPLPHDGGGLTYSVVPGRFLDFCRRADQRNDTCVLIVDEINLANLARVFGELMYLLEYRDQEIPLAGGGVLRIPTNVRIIGTMNTADRSIALVDHALRRQFAFLALNPDYSVLRRYHEREDTSFSVAGLCRVLQQLNHAINDRHYEVGITFFLRRDLAEQLPDIWTMEIEPYLEEYFFDQPDKANGFRWARVSESILS